MPSFPSLRSCLPGLFLLLISVTTEIEASPENVLASAWQQARRFANLSSFLGSAKRTAKTPYDRVMGHPVFQVTTPWGAPYMNFEKVSAEEQMRDNGGADVMGADSESRPVTLFYMDAQDAIQMHQEMKQMSNMGSADIRLTCTTLAKALRQASNLGNGLVTGSPVDPLTGKLASSSEGGSLRYKIVPPRRQLFYAARCVGKERVGLFGRNAIEDAETFVEGTNYIHQVNLDRRKDAQERRSQQGRTAQQQINRHMEGYTGIPVFFSPSLRRQPNIVKRLVSGGGKYEHPFFFSYEDMQEAWSTMRKQAKNAASIPEKPNDLEVYNLMDVLTSMERDEWAQKRKDAIQWKDPVGSLQRLLGPPKVSNRDPGLEAITFVPPSNCVEYKEAISARGNGKARLRPMR